MTASTRKIASITPMRVARHGPGLVTYDVVDGPAARIDPFIVVSLYDMSGPTFPPHPHAGFSVATYILPESPVGFVNQDTLGHFNPIPPGALHWTTAGAGVQHEEQPAAPGVARGFQIWIDHAAEDRAMPPDARHLPAADVPETEIGGAQIRVVLGASNGIVSPLATPTAVRLVDVRLEPGARFDQTLEADETAFIVVIDGALAEGGAAGEAVHYAADGESLSATAKERGARLLLFAGRPLNAPRAARGPFVANDAAQLQDFMRRYSAGAFGALVPFAERLKYPAPRSGT